MDKNDKILEEIELCYYYKKMEECNENKEYYETVKEYIENNLLHVSSQLDSIEEFRQGMKKRSAKAALLMSLTFLGVSGIFDYFTAGPISDGLAKIFYAFSVLKPTVMGFAFYNDFNKVYKKEFTSANITKEDLDYLKWFYETKQKEIFESCFNLEELAKFADLETKLVLSPTVK